MPVPIPYTAEDYINVFDYYIANGGVEVDEVEAQEKRTALLSYLQIVGLALYYACMATQGVLQNLGIPVNLGCTPPPQ